MHAGTAQLVGGGAFQTLNALMVFVPMVPPVEELQ